MSNTSFSFPGFDITGNADNDHMRVDIGTLTHREREYVLQMLISKNAPDHATHAVAKVEFDSKIVWQYDRDRDSECFTRLTLVNDEPVIGYVHKKTGRLVKTHPFLLFTRKLPLTVAMQIAYKRGAAEYLGITPEYTTAEESFRQNDPTERQLAAEAKAKREADKAKREAEQKAKREEREAKRKQVRQDVAGREQVTVKSTDGRTMFGKPVVAGEIPHLEHKKFYVLVDKINSAGEACDPQKAFLAVAQSGKGIVMAKGGFDVVGFVDTTLVMPESSSTVNFELNGGEVFEVPIYANKGEIDTLTKIGVDMIEFAAFPAGNKGKYRVFILDGSQGKTELYKAGLLSPYEGEQIAAE